LGVDTRYRTEVERIARGDVGGSRGKRRLATGWGGAAVKLVLAGDVELLADGTPRVGSQSEPETVYQVNGACPCPDFPKAPHEGMCKHRIAVGIAKRAQELLCKEAQALDDQAAPAEASAPLLPPQAAAAGLPEAPASANCYIDLHGRKVQVTLRGTDADEVLAKMARCFSAIPWRKAPRR
jgi:hypothetical protein